MYMEDADKAFFGLESPGPGAYVQAGGLGRQKLSTKESAPTFKMGTSQRFSYDYVRRAKDTPGAGQYPINGAVGKQPVSTKKSLPAYRFGSSNRDVYKKASGAQAPAIRTHAGACSCRTRCERSFPCPRRSSSRRSTRRAPTGRTRPAPSRPTCGARSDASSCRIRRPTRLGASEPPSARRSRSTTPRALVRAVLPLAFLAAISMGWEREKMPACGMPSTVLGSSSRRLSRQHGSASLPRLPAGTYFA